MIIFVFIVVLERQEQFGALGRELGSQELDTRAFRLRVIALLNQYPEVHGAAWLDAQKRLRSSGGATFNWSYPAYGSNAVALDSDGDTGSCARRRSNTPSL